MRNRGHDTERDPHRIERAEIAATRRRWITLAELVAIAGLIIAAIGTWTTWSDHRIELGRSERDRAIDAKVRGLVLLGGMAIDDGKKLVVSDDAHRLQQVVFRFPAQLDVASRTSMIDPAIDASWFATSVLQGSGGDRRSGRLPVLITSIFWNADQLASDSAIYDVIWESKARLLRSRRLVLRGIVLRERNGSAARLDRLWAGELRRH